MPTPTDFSTKGEIEDVEKIFPTCSLLCVRCFTLHAIASQKNNLYLENDATQDVSVSAK